LTTVPPIIEKPPSAVATVNTLIDSTLKFFVGGLHPNTDEGELSAHFAKYGQILASQVMRDMATGRHRGFGFVTLKVQPNTMSVFKDTHVVSGKRVDVRAMQTDVAASLRKKIFVGGLSKALNEEMLQEYFSKFGEVDKVTIMRQLDGTSRGFGFIVFMTEEGAVGSLKNPTHFVYGNKVDVRAAETRPKTTTPAPSAAVYPYGVVQTPTDMYSASQMYRPQATYDPSQYANMTQQQMLQQYPQYQLLQQQMVQQQMAMAGTYGNYYSTSGQQPTSGQTASTGSNSSNPYGTASATATNPYAAATASTANPYGATAATAANPYATGSNNSANPYAAAAASGNPYAAATASANPYAASSAAYGAYRGKDQSAYQAGATHADVSSSRGYRQHPY